MLTKYRINHFWFWGLIFLFTLFKGVYFSHFGLNIYDYGEILHNATRILEDGVLYRDIWSFFPPGFNYFPALVFTIFGKSLLIIRFVESAIFALLVVVLACLSRNYLSKWMLVLLSATLIFSDLNTYLFFYYTFYFSAILFFIRFLKSENLLWMLGSGILAGTGLLFRHDTGIITAVVIVVASIVYKEFGIIKNKLIQAGVMFYLGLFSVSLFVLLPILKSVSLGDFLFLAFVRAPQVSRTLSSGFNLARIFNLNFDYSHLLDVFTAVCYLVFVGIYILTTIHLLNRFRQSRVKVRNYLKDNAEIVVIFLFGVFQLPHAFSIIEMGHLVKAGFSAILLGFFFLEKLSYSKVRSFRLLSYLLPLAFIFANLTISVWWINFNDTEVSLPYGQVYLNSKAKKGTTYASASTIQRSIAFINQNSNPEDNIFVAPYHAILYFLTGRRSPNKFNNFVAGLLDKSDQDLIVKSIEEGGVKVIVYDPQNGPHGKKFLDYSPKVHNFIMENFDIIETTSEGWLLMIKK